MKVLLYYTYEYTQRSGCKKLLEEEAEKRGYRFFSYYRELGDLSIIPFKPDIIITRTSVSGTVQDYMNIDSFVGVPVVNKTNSCLWACDKSFYYDVLSAKKINVPHFRIIEENMPYESFRFEVPGEFGFPFVIKHPVSSQGRAVFLIKSQERLDEFMAEHQGKKN